MPVGFTSLTAPNSMPADSLPLTEKRAPASAEEAVELVAACAARRTPIYPLGGETALDYGLPAKQPGLGLSLSAMNRVLDYPARDMTITLEAGVTLAALQQTLAAEGQRLPLDAPRAAEATLGGIVATNTSGPSRCGHGTVRDYVIGISAIDGRGTPFKAGGRVVKNVAGYDFCKLLTGSLGTLGVITQITLKVKPLAQRRVLLACEAADLAQADALLAALNLSEVTPLAVELLGGPAWKDLLTNPQGWLVAVALEGTEPEVAWLEKALRETFKAAGAANVRELPEEVWSRCVEFPAAGDAPLVLRASLAPSAVTRFFEAARKLDPAASLLAHAASGVAIVRFAEFPEQGLSRALVGNLVPIARAGEGHVVVLSNPGGSEMTRPAVWGGLDTPTAVMTAVKRQFDPYHLLNPGRFVYDEYPAPVAS